MSFSNRPKIKVELTPSEKTVEWLSWVILFSLWVLPLMYIARLPDAIPIHFALSGHADKFGSKYMIFIMPAIATLVFMLLYIIARYPESLNYPIPITEDNAPRLYHISRVGLRYIRVATLFVFMQIICTQLFPAYQQFLGSWTVFIVVVVTFIPLSWLIVKLVKAK